MIAARDRSRPRVWGLAFLATLVLHVGAALGARALGLFVPVVAPPRDPEPVELVFLPDPEPPAPKLFSELPPERADDPADRPDFLSNVDSRARDRIPGGEDNLPRSEGRSEAPQVALTRGAPKRAVASPPPREPSPPSSSTSAADGESPLPPELSLVGRLIQERITSQGEETPAETGGSSDLFQEPLDHPTGNAALTGDISLSTTAWDFAPWLMAFRRAVLSRWRAPDAYYMGLIHGWTHLELEILPDGRLRELEVVAEDVGHKSLTTAAIFALEGAAPYRPLPDHFPDETLILRIKFFYPNLRP